MIYPTREAAHRAMIDMAEREFKRALRLPRFFVAEKAASGGFVIGRRGPSAEDGLSREVGRISTSH